MKKIFQFLIAMSMALSVLSAQAGITDKLYFGTYLAKYLADFSAYRQEHPLATNPLSDFAFAKNGLPESIAIGIATKIDPALFLRGASTSEHQCSQKCTPEICSWSRFAQEHHLPQPGAKPGMNWWKHYRSYLDYAADTMNLNAMRFSIEWALVQPNGPDSWDAKVLNHYAKLFIYALKKGIAPVVCFHHYSDPIWFLDRGGFEKDTNVDCFVSYCQTVYAHIMQAIADDASAQQALQEITPRTPLWATFNAPDGYAFRGYHQKQGPPANSARSGLKMVAQVIKNTLESHVRVYQAMKKVHRENELINYNIAEPSIGLLKNIHQIDPAIDTWKHYCAAPLTRCMAGVADMIQNGSIYRFFTTGQYRVHIPFLIDIKHENKDAMSALDFIGLNYYSNRHLYLTQTVEPTDPELRSDNKIYYHYPQGMYRAIVELHEKLVKPYQAQGKKLPLIVAENGIATKDDQKRNRFYHEYLAAISCAVKAGYPVAGYLPWTLATNYEWPSIENNTERDYGLCSVDEQDPSQLHIKEGAKSYMQFAAQMKKMIWYHGKLDTKNEQKAT